MTCSVCHQKGHNKRTCELNTKVATTGKYAGLTAVQIEAIFAERERKNYEELVAPIIAPKLACADCGQVETECHLERLVGGKVMCCDCLYPENQEDDDETVSVVSEDTCECCGRPYDHRNPHRQSEMCDCVQNDDGTLSRPEVSICEACGVPETDECRPDCAYQARRQREEEEEHRTRTSPTRDQLVALGKYKLAKFQISKREHYDETNWNEDGDDELCSAIDASGNALY
jgi:hypothetical protein